MATIRAAKRYAKAIFQKSQTENITEQVVKDMQLIQETLTDSKDLSNALENPVIDIAKKVAILKEVFSKTSTLTLNSFEVLGENGRIDHLKEMAKQFIALYRESKNIKKAQVTTAVPLTEELRKKILNKVENLTGASVELEHHIDHNLLGGFILRVDDKQFDASVSGRLNTLRNQLKSSVTV